MRAAVLAMIVAALAGCATIAPPKPWEKGNFVRPDMLFDFDRLDARSQQRTFAAKEAAAGGYAVGGGGCGCN